MAAAKKKSETAVAVKQADGSLATYDYGNQAGAGWDNVDREDVSIPFINQLQSLSPEVEEGGDRQVEGARAGRFVNSVTQELFDEISFVPCITQHVVVEWVPREQGGGFVGIHQRNSEVVREAKANAADPLHLVSAEGNDLIDTFYIFAAILDEAGEEVVDLVVMAFTKTKQKAYRRLITRLRTVKGSANIPLFAHRVTMRAVKAKNSAGHAYFNVQMDPMIDGDVLSSLLPPDSPILVRAQEFGRDVVSGDREVKHEAAEPTESKKDEVF